MGLYKMVDRATIHNKWSVEKESFTLGASPNVCQPIENAAGPGPDRACLGLYASEEIINRHVKRERKAETYIEEEALRAGCMYCRRRGWIKYIYIYSKSEGIE